MTKLITIFLSVAGLLLLGIGGMIAFAPQAFHESNGILLGAGPTLLSEIRAPGGALLSFGLVALAAAIRKCHAVTAMRLMTLVYGSYGIGRVVSMIFDGMPSASLVNAAIVELSISMIGVALLYLNRRNHASITPTDQACAA